MKFRKKLILAELAILLLLITTVTTTFAWFSLNDAAWVDDFEMEIYNSDQLLIRHESGSFKQMLTQDDIVAAINDERKDNKISSLNEINFSEVYSTDGNQFLKLVPKYDDMNRKSLSFETANLNSYLQFKLIFRVEQGNSNDGQTHPDYYLTLSMSDEEGVKKTNFSSSDQKLKLLNSLITQNNSYNMDDTLTVNPVNALRLSIKGDPASTNSSVDYIYELTDENDLGSYAIDERILQSLSIDDKKYYSSQNAGFTYYNNINNDILSPLGYYESEDTKIASESLIKSLISKLKYDFSDYLGQFKYNEEIQSYNDVIITVGLWLEGFDADNLIGLDSSVIKCLLSFKLVEGGNGYE